MTFIEFIGPNSARSVGRTDDNVIKITSKTGPIAISAMSDDSKRYSIALRLSCEC
jgi:hypothetical protein